MSKRRLIENAISLGTVQIVSMGLPLISLPYLAMRLGAGPLGKMAFAIAVAQIFLILTDYGFNLSASREVSVNRADKKRIAEVWVAVTTLRTLFAAAGLLVLLLISVVYRPLSDDLSLILIAYLAVLGNVLFPQWLFQGLETMRAVSIVQVLVRFLMFGTIFVLVRSPEDVHWAVFTQSAGTLVAGLVSIPWTRKALAGAVLARPEKVALTAQLRGGWHVFVSSALTTLYTQANTIILGVLAAPSVVGHYYIAERLVRATQMVYGPISNTIYPHISRLAGVDRQLALQFVGKILRFAVLLGLVFCFAIYLFGPVAVSYVFGPENAEAGSILRVFCMLPLVLLVSNTLGIQTMLPFGMQSNLSRIYFLAAGLNLLIFIPLTYYVGAHGAAAANVVVEMFVVMLMFHRLRCERIDIVGAALNRFPVAVPEHASS